MGDQNVNQLGPVEDRASFIKCLLNDIKAMELMLQKGLIENDIIRVGSEQEFCLVDNSWRPAKSSEALLKEINDPHFTTELAQYNLEINLDPFELTGDCFTKISKQLNELLNKAKAAGEKHDTKIVLSGILPTISKHELEFDYMTPNPRYWALNDILKVIKGGDFQLHIKGVDELTISHDSVLYEACNTSFQMHLQIAPEDFISSYNWAQAIAGPILGISTNSPLLLGRELWSETRIALFQQSIDTRRATFSLKDQPPRVTFGDHWASGSIVEIFKDDIAKYKIVLTKEIQKDSLEVLKEGKIPKLEALQLNNSTIYRWNRPCYGVGGGKAHVRIENRYIGSGPSTLDEIANFAFWVGVMVGRPKKFDDIAKVMDFREAKSNFNKAARYGKDVKLEWMGNLVSVPKLIKNELLPIAYDGLEKVGIDKNDINMYLGIIEKRTNNQTGSEWMIKNYRTLNDNIRKDDALRLLTRAIYKNQQGTDPVHKWPGIKADKYLKEVSHLVGHVMTTQLSTVRENDLASLATSLMKWKNIHHVPVENDNGQLSGLLTWTHALKFHDQKTKNPKLVVADIMQDEVITVQPGTHIKDAIRTMKKRKIGCLPVVQNNELVGIITIKDVIGFDND